MTRLFGLILLALAVACSSKDPVAPFSCILDRQVEAGITTEFTYTDQGVLLSYTMTTGSSGGGETHNFSYDANGRVTTEHVIVSPTFQYSNNFTYGSDGKVSQYTYVPNGTNAGVYSYSRSGDTVTETFVETGQSGASTTIEYTYAGENVIKEVSKEFYGPNRSLSSVTTTDRSNFDTNYSAKYSWHQRAKGVPFAYSRNNPEKEKVTVYGVVNGVNQSPSTTNYIFNYTFNSSKAVLTREVTIAGSSSSSSIDSYFYDGCN